MYRFNLFGQFQWFELKLCIYIDIVEICDDDTISQPKMSNVRGKGKRKMNKNDQVLKAIRNLDTKLGTSRSRSFGPSKVRGASSFIGHH
jgi:hypothetical protein